MYYQVLTYEPRRRAAQKLLVLHNLTFIINIIMCSIIKAYMYKEMMYILYISVSPRINDKGRGNW